MPHNEEGIEADDVACISKLHLKERFFSIGNLAGPHAEIGLEPVELFQERFLYGKISSADVS